MVQIKSENNPQITSTNMQSQHCCMELDETNDNICHNIARSSEMCDSCDQKSNTLVNHFDINHDKNMRFGVSSSL